MHRNLSRESFESGRSINQICVGALVAREALKDRDPWKAVERLWARNRRVDPARAAADVREAIREARSRARP